MTKLNPKVFLRAAKLLEDKGWCRDTSEDDKGRHCMMGAISEFLPGQIDIKYSEYRDFIKDRLLKGVWPTDWNDNYPSRRKYQVIALLKKAAKECVK